MTIVETQWDAVIGATHHYAGLSHGNVASKTHANSISNPKQAALQGLDKMRLVASLGVPQYVLPPQPRPNLAMLNALGFAGEAEEQLRGAAALAPTILSAAYSASSMWSANMATCAPAHDSRFGTMQFTPANLMSTLHRPQEAAWNEHVLQQLWVDVAQVHAPLPSSWVMADEGAANHMRLCGEHGDVGVHVFVYGRATGLSTEQLPKHYPARQTREACEALARLHGLDMSKVIYVQQSPDAIDAGVFHNDVIAMSNQNVLIYHEKAFVDSEAFLDKVRHALAPVPLIAIKISEVELPLKEAVGSYFFNSQLLSLPDGRGMAVIAPKECEENAYASALLLRMKEDEANPISEHYFPDVRESMKNGGGPACLRLRIVVDEIHLPHKVKGLKWNALLDKRLREVIIASYPDAVTIKDLSDVSFMKIAHKAHADVLEVLNLQ